jgi:hypothetical protein
LLPEWKGENPMRPWIIGLLTAGTLLTAALPAAAQTRPHVSGSESSRSSGPTCVVNGDASACETSSAGGAVSWQPGPILVGVAPIIAPVLGGDAGGRANTDTNVNRSSRNGSALAR